MAVGPRRPGNWWNEHVNCAIALWCDEATFRAVQACAEDRRAHTGTYNLITYNCLTFCDEALAAGGIHLLTESGRELHTIDRGLHRHGGMHAARLQARYRLGGSGRHPVQSRLCR